MRRLQLESRELKRNRLAVKSRDKIGTLFPCRGAYLAILTPESKVTLQAQAREYGGVVVNTHPTRSHPGEHNISLPRAEVWSRSRLRYPALWESLPGSESV